jgi:predicted metal-dependent peptidase
MLDDVHAQEPAMSTISEIAANLSKREDSPEKAATQAGPRGPMGWEQLMMLSKEKDVLKWQAALSRLIADNPGQRRVTVMRVIQGGLA